MFGLDMWKLMSMWDIQMEVSQGHLSILVCSVGERFRVNIMILEFLSTKSCL